LSTVNKKHSFLPNKEGHGRSDKNPSKKKSSYELGMLLYLKRHSGHENDGLRLENTYF